MPILAAIVLTCLLGKPASAETSETSVPPSPQSEAEVLAHFNHEPTIAVVQDWARRASRTSPEAIHRLMRASGRFAALPEVDVGYRVKDAWGQDWVYRNPFGSTPMPGDEVLDVLDEADRDRDHWITLEASWNLQELVMSSERIRAINEAQDLVKLRDTVLTEVTRLYFERRRQQVQMLLSPSPTVQGQLNDSLRLQELTASIDALTDGRFSTALSPPGEVP